MYSTKKPIFTAKRLYSAIITITFVASIGAADHFPYQLQRCDIALSPAATALFCGGMVLEFAVHAPPQVSRVPLPAADINRFDRPAVYRWSPGTDRLSDIGLCAIMLTPALPALPLLRERAWLDIATLATMYGEAVLFSAGLSATVKDLTLRDRPYLYNGTIPAAELNRLTNDRDSRRSFYSRHTALAFCSAVFLSKTTTDIYGTSKPTAAVWCGSLAAATAVGVSRYAAGQHFPTDILAGAAVGSLVGYGVPWLHRKKERRSVEVGITGDRLVALWRF